MIVRLRSAASVLGCAALALAGLATPAAAQHYANKTVNMIINFGAGGTTDIAGRIFLRHLPNHIKGKPTVIISNRPGGGGLVGSNYLGSGAVKPDGLTFGFFTIGPISPLVDDPALKVKYSAFEFVAGYAQYTIAIGRKDIEPGMEKPSDIVKAKALFLGGYNPTSTLDMRLRLTLDLMGKEYKMVSGFRSSGDIAKALAQKEVNFSSAGMPYYQTQTIPNLIKPGIVIPFWYYQVTNPDGSYKKNELLESQGVRSFAQIYEETMGKKPAGPKWEAFVLVNNLATQMLRAVMLPPGTPKAVVDELREAFVSLQKDPEFNAEHEKVIGEKSDMVSAEDGARTLRQLDAADPAVKAVLKEMLAAK